MRRGGATGLPKAPLRPTPATVLLVWRRDEGRCICCGTPLVWEERGTAFGWSAHHRVDKSLGGRNDATNLGLLAGSGTTRCHGAATDEASPFRPRGIVLNSWENPAETVVNAWDGDWLYTPDGGRTAA